MQKIMFFTAAFAAELPMLIPTNDDPTCWKLAYGRGVGKPITSCDKWYPEN
jgi:hypothetical protein